MPDSSVPASKDMGKMVIGVAVTAGILFVLVWAATKGYKVAKA